jgi:hypothetical protein
MNKRLSPAALLIALGISMPAGTTTAQDQVSAPQGQNCALRIVAALDMQAIPDRRVTIPVKFDGHDHRLMVDTGGYINTVTPQLAREEGY